MNNWDPEAASYALQLQAGELVVFHRVYSKAINLDHIGRPAALAAARQAVYGYRRHHSQPRGSSLSQGFFTSPIMMRKNQS